MLYLVVFLTLNSLLRMSSSSPWDNFIDRLDLFIKESYLIIQCNEKEVEIIRYFTTYEEFQLNLECTNKNEILQHGIDKVQIVDFLKVLKICQNDNKVIRIESFFKQIKASLTKEQNGVEWPFLHTPFTKTIIKSNPKEISFSTNDPINIIITDFNTDDLPEEKETVFLHFEFVNRPLLCRIRITGLQKKTNDGTCDPNIFDKVSEPICYYKVGGRSTPTNDDLNPIHKKTFAYAISQDSPYIYISDIDAFDQENSQSEEANPVDDSSSGKTDQSKKKLSAKTKKKKKSNILIIIIIIFLILFILICVGLFIFYQQYWIKKQNGQLTKQGSDSSFESQISQSSYSGNSTASDQDISDTSVNHSTKNKTQKRNKAGATQMFKVDDEI